ncbi:hypothetical protein NYE71_31175 [Bacillus sp. FSL K6-0273]|uniref:hypothetical protein n=1 Tax=Bacillus sp. FSL K6-0273 TaxID=2975328 RepID=UPI0030FB565F
MSAIKIEDIYQELLDGKRKQFPPYTWSEDIDRNLIKRVIKYLVEIVLNWDDNMLKEGWNKKLIKKYKLNGAVCMIYRGSPYAMLNDAYPGRFKEWEFKMAPLNFWTKEKGLEALKWTIEIKEKLTDEQLLQVYGTKWLTQHKIISPCAKFFNHSPYIMLNALYPGKFREWEMKQTPNKFWTRENALEALRWTIEEKEELTDEQLFEVYNIKWLKQHNLAPACQIHWRNSPYSMLNALYPNRFKEWMFKVTPSNFWTREKGLEALRWTIEEKEKLTNKQLLCIYSQPWLNRHKLNTPMKRYWNGSPYAFLNSLYPGVFKEWDMKMAPINFWTKEKGLEALKWTIEEKEKLTDEQLLRVYGSKWLQEHKINTPCSKYWNGSPYAMLNELYPGRFKEWELENVPSNFWTKEKSIEVIKWNIESKEKLIKENLIQIINTEWIKIHRLITPFNKHWNGNIYAMLNELYPGDFKKWELKKVSNNYWTKEIALEVIREILQEKGNVSNEEFLQEYNMEWIKRNGLTTPLAMYWSNNPYNLLHDAYPDRFTQEVIKAYKRIQQLRPIIPQDVEFSHRSSNIVLTIEEIYQEVLNGKRDSFPYYVWSEGDKKLLARRVTKYLIEVILNWDTEEIKKGWNGKVIKKYKLNGMISLVYNGSPYAMLNDLYPNRFKEWELSYTPSNFWTKETAIEALRWTIEEKEKLTDEQLGKVYSQKWLVKHKLASPCYLLFNSSPYAMLNELYPNRFKEWELSYTPSNFWTKETAIEALRWTIEEKEQLTGEQLLKVYSDKWLQEKRILTPCCKYWNCSPYAMLNELYPNHFKQWELKNVPSNFWTKEIALEALRWTIEEKEKLTDEQLKKVYNIAWLKKQRLITPLLTYWSLSPYMMLNELYPGRFKEWEFSVVPRNFWTKEKGLEALRWTIEEKEKLTDEQLLKMYSNQWLVRHRLVTPLNKHWNNSYEMLNDLYPNRFKEWELQKVSKNFWTKEKGLEALRWTIEEKEKLTDEQLLRVYDITWMKKHRIGMPVYEYWSNNPYLMLHDLYPNKFSKEVMKTYVSVRKWFKDFFETEGYSKILNLVWENSYVHGDTFVFTNVEREEVIQFFYQIKGTSSIESRYNELKGREEWYCTLSKWHPLVLKLKELGWETPEDSTSNLQNRYIPVN